MNVNSAYSIWKDRFYGILQGFMLGPLLFNIHLCYLFCFLENTETSQVMQMIALSIRMRKTKGQSLLLSKHRLKLFLIGLVTIL